MLLCLVKFARSAPALIKEGDPLLAVVGLIGFGLGFAVLTLFYFWGAWTDPIAARLSFPLQLALLVAILYAGTLLLKTRARMRAAQVVAGVFIVGYMVPANARHQATRDMTASYAVAWTVDYVLTHCDETTLTLSASSLPFVCNGRPAAGFGVASRNAALLQLEWPATPYRQILVIEGLARDERTGKWEVWRGSNLTPTIPGMVLEPVAERAFAGGTLTRISRLVRYEAPASPSPPQLPSGKMASRLARVQKAATSLCPFCGPKPCFARALDRVWVGCEPESRCNFAAQNPSNSLGCYHEYPKPGPDPSFNRCSRLPSGCPPTRTWPVPPRRSRRAERLHPLRGRERGGRAGKRPPLCPRHKRGVLGLVAVRTASRRWSPRTRAPQHEGHQPAEAHGVLGRGDEREGGARAARMRTIPA